MSDFYLDPKTAESSRATYDATGYDKLYFSSIQQSNFTSERYLDSLLLNGYSLNKIIDQKLTKEILDGRGEMDESRSKEFDQVFYFKDNDLLKEVLKKILIEDVEKTILNYYYSNFAVIFAVLLKTLPKEEKDLKDNPSMAWHCDMGPSNHLKLLITLSEDEHGGGTEYLNRETTDLLKKIGYGFVPIEHRKFDLKPLAEKNNIPFNIDLVKPKCGEGIFFEPARTMHRGFRPTKGESHRLVLGFIPWPANWENFHNQNPDFTFKNVGMSFPKINP